MAAASGLGEIPVRSRESFHEGKACSTGPARAASCKSTSAGLRKCGNCQAAQNDSANGQSTLQSNVLAVWHHQRNQARKTRNPLISEAARFGSKRYRTREEEQRVIEVVAQGLKNGEVAGAIGTTENVVTSYLRVTYDELGV
jgi:DNA-binding NarL/FixJ family response regulator